MTAVALALHIFGAVVWVGGMFAIYVCLRPALGTLEPPQRLRLMRCGWRPWLTFKRAVDAEDWPSAGATLNRIRQIIAVNLPLGLLVVLIGGSGRYWG
jgi:uncharacterized membrane protein